MCPRVMIRFRGNRKCRFNNSTTGSKSLSFQKCVITVQKDIFINKNPYFLNFYDEFIDMLNNFLIIPISDLKKKRSRKYKCFSLPLFLIR